MPIEDARGADGQAREEARRIRQRQPGQEAVRRRHLRVEPVRLAEPSPDPVGLERADPDVDRSVRAQEAVRKPRRVVAHDDRVSAARAPPEVPRAEAESGPTPRQRDLALPGIQPPEAFGPEALREVDHPPRVGELRLATRPDRRQLERRVLRIENGRRDRHGQRPPSHRGLEVERAGQPLALPHGPVVLSGRVSGVDEEPQARAQPVEACPTGLTRRSRLDALTPRMISEVGPAGDEPRARPDRERARHGATGDLEQPQVLGAGVVELHRLAERGRGYQERAAHDEPGEGPRRALRVRPRRSGPGERSGAHRRLSCCRGQPIAALSGRGVAAPRSAGRPPNVSP